MQYCEGIEAFFPEIGKFCLTLVDDIDNIIHLIVDKGFSPTHICCMWHESGDRICTEEECQEPTKEPPTTAPGRQ